MLMQKLKTRCNTLWPPLNCNMPEEMLTGVEPFSIYHFSVCHLCVFLQPHQYTLYLNHVVAVWTSWPPCKLHPTLFCRLLHYTVPGSAAHWPYQLVRGMKWVHLWRLAANGKTGAVWKYDITCDVTDDVTGPGQVWIISGDMWHHGLLSWL